jgi:hypothetical protein
MLAFVVMFTSISFENTAYAAGPPDITRIELQTITETDGSVTERYLIWGSNFQDPNFIIEGYTIDSSIYTKENSAYVINRSSKAGLYPDLWQIPADGDITIEVENSDGSKDSVDFSIRVKPTITNISAVSKKVYVGKALTIEGTGFTDGSSNDIDTVYVSGTTYKHPGDYSITPEKNIHIATVKDPHTQGISDIMVVKDTGDSGFIGKIVGVYKDAITVVKETDIIDPDKMKIIPNTGPIEGGTRVRIFDEATKSNLKPDMKIYVDSISAGNLFTDIKLILDPANSSKVIGISGLTPPSPTGAQGFFDIIITDKTGSNEQRIDNAFTYEEKENLLKLIKVDPVSGKAGAIVNVKGKNILNLNIPYIEDVEYLDENGTNVVSNLVGKRVGNKLVIFYRGDDKNNPGSKLKVKREIELIIGQVAEIQETDLIVSPTVDEIKVKIPSTSETGLVDVTINATTTITDSSNVVKEIREEEDKLVDGFDLIPSVSQPEISEIQPAKGDVHKRIYLTIKGKKFQVLSNVDLTPDFPEITVGTRKATVTAVYDDEGNVVNGVGREFGTIIKAYIPKLGPSDSAAHGPVDVRIENPDKGDTVSYKGFEFLNPDPAHKPKIKSIEPNIGSLDGGNVVVIEGEGFAHTKPVPDVIVTIDGQIANVNSATNTTIEIVVPKGISIGEKPVQVITEDGAMDTIEVDDSDREGYTYVRRLSDPEVETIAPSFGGEGTVVYIFGKNKGDEYPNFYKPIINPSARVEEMAGTRVLLNGIDVNDMGIDEATYPDGSLYERAAKNSDGTLGNLRDTDKNGNIFDIPHDDANAPRGFTIEIEDESGTKVKALSRVEVIDDNTLRIMIPGGYAAGLKDVTILNPDSSTVTVKDGFDYKIPPLNADVRITEIDPNIGTNLGGDYITITGKDFKDGAQVYFGGYKSDSVRVSTEHTLIVKTPPYPLPNPDVISQKDVEVVVVNYDGSSAASPADPASVDEPSTGYRYMAPKTKPQISSIEPDTGTTLGNELVTIIGQDFRMVTHDKDHTPLAKAEYPKVFFGGREVKEEDFLISEFKHNRIVVRTPFYGKEGVVDITVKNPQLEFGSVTKTAAFTYRTSKPKINSVFPKRGQKSGGDEIVVKGTEILAGDFTGQIEIVPSSSGFKPVIDVLAIFGDEKFEKPLRFGEAKGTLGDIKVDYKSDRPETQVPDGSGGTTTTTDSLIIYHVDDEGNEKAIAHYPLESEKRMIFVMDWKELGIDISQEAIVVELMDDNLIARRRVAPRADVLNSSDDNPIKKVEIQTPPALMIGPKDLYIENKDRGWDKISFEYIHPSSRPAIRQILPNSRHPKADPDRYYVESTVEGGLYITIDGYDLRQGAEVFIDGVLAPLVSMNLLSNSDSEDPEGRPRSRLIVMAPKGEAKKLNEELQIMIINPDGGFVDASDTSKIVPGSSGAEVMPYYFVYRIPESDPYIDSILPTETSQAGGNPIRIIGYDFRGGLRVVIGGMQCPAVNPADIHVDEIVAETPTDLTPGIKDVQVINSDYGAVTKSPGITVISFPIINGVHSEGGDAVDRVSIEGGEKIVLSGKNFQSGASVYFGGEIKKIGDSDDASIKGLFKDDDYYAVEDAYSANEVEFINENKLIVTVPEVLKEGKYTITVLNSDGGISYGGVEDPDEGYVLLEYRVPIPTNPIGLEAEIVNDKYIRIYGYSSVNTSYYEVYACIDENSPDDDDFKYLDTTEKTSYKITKFKELDDDENIYLRIRAVNKYGPSQWSNVAKISYRELDDIDGIGNEDTDGDLVSDYQESIGSNGVNVVLGHKNLKGNDYYIYVIDLKDKKYDKIDKRVINIPGKIIRNSNKALLMDNGDTKLQLNVRNFYVYSFINMGPKDQESTYGRIVFNRASGKDSDYMQRKIPRKYKLISRVYDIKAEFQMQQKTTKLDSMAGYMDLEIGYDDNRLNGIKETKLQLYKYYAKEGKWIPLAGGVNPDTNKVHARIDGPGQYAILGEK